ncbi:hypothetical protein ACQY0O_007686 [Thecaphora frezii]
MHNLGQHFFALSTSAPFPTPLSRLSRAQPAHLVYRDDDNLAFLDILPLRRGHTLVVPKAHVATLSQLEPQQAASLAQALVAVTRAVGKALGDDRLQVITNQIYAQVVPHVHFHIVPAPPLPSSALSPSASLDATATRRAKTPASRPLWIMGHGREELDDHEAHELARLIRQAVKPAGSECNAKL